MLDNTVVARVPQVCVCVFLLHVVRIARANRLIDQNNEETSAFSGGKSNPRPRGAKVGRNVETYETHSEKKNFRQHIVINRSLLDRLDFCRLLLAVVSTSCFLSLLDHYLEVHF